MELDIFVFRFQMHLKLFFVMINSSPLAGVIVRERQRHWWTNECPTLLKKHRLAWTHFAEGETRGKKQIRTGCRSKKDCCFCWAGSLKRCTGVGCFTRGGLWVSDRVPHGGEEKKEEDEEKGGHKKKDETRSGKAARPSLAQHTR